MPTCGSVGIGIASRLCTWFTLLWMIKRGVELCLLRFSAPKIRQREGWCTEKIAHKHNKRSTSTCMTELCNSLEVWCYGVMYVQNENYFAPTKSLGTEAKLAQSKRKQEILTVKWRSAETITKHSKSTTPTTFFILSQTVAARCLRLDSFFFPDEHSIQQIHPIKNDVIRSECLLYTFDSGKGLLSRNTALQR